MFIVNLDVILCNIKHSALHLLTPQVSWLTANTNVIRKDA